MILALVLLLLLLCAVVWLISGPLRSGARTEAGESTRQRLESEKESKYAEIRDAELDLRTGKLSQEDFALLHQQLRSEAAEILHRLDELS